MFVATLCRLLFFGGRYVSALWLARQLGAQAGSFLLVVAVVEVLRVAFDFGMENAVLARLHQRRGPTVEQDVARFAPHKDGVRRVATLVGQVVVLAFAAALTLGSGLEPALLVATCLQFTALMGYGWLQAHVQTGPEGGMRRLVVPLALAAAVQIGLLVAVTHGQLASIWVAASFEWLSLLGCLVASRRSLRVRVGMRRDVEGVDSRTTPTLDGARHVLATVSPLGITALLSLAYGRLDVFLVGALGQGVTTTQYLGFQRIASAPLMLASTVASASMAGLSAAPSGSASRLARSHLLRGYAGAAAAVVAAALAARWFDEFLQLPSVHRPLWALQSAVLGLQIVNAFNASLYIAQRRSRELVRIAKVNAVVAVVAIPLGAWCCGLEGVAAGVALVEGVGWLQYVRGTPRTADAAHDD